MKEATKTSFLVKIRLIVLLARTRRHSFKDGHGALRPAVSKPNQDSCGLNSWKDGLSSCLYMTSALSFRKLHIMSTPPRLSGTVAKPDSKAALYCHHPDEVSVPEKNHNRRVRIVTAQAF